MQPPQLYSIESYEPTTLTPDEINQNNNLRRALTDKNVSRFYFNLSNNIPNNVPTLNPQIINNNQLVNNNIINPNYRQNKFHTIIPKSIPLNNPFIINNLKANNTNKVFNTIQFNNPFSNQKINTLQYINPVLVVKNSNYYPKKNIPQIQVVPLPHNNVNRSKSSRYIPTFPQFSNVQPVNVTRNNNMMPIYRRIINRKKL